MIKKKKRLLLPMQTIDKGIFNVIFLKTTIFSIARVTRKKIYRIFFAVSYIIPWYHNAPKFMC